MIGSTVKESSTKLRSIAALVVIVIMPVSVAEGVHHLLPAQLWWSALVSPDPSDVRQIIVHDSFLPRVAVSLLAGALLALSGTVMQQVLNNPLAEPGTLGTSAGAHLALVVASVAAPELPAWMREWVAVLGSAIATFAVIGFAAVRTFSPITLILAGLVVGLLCGSLSTVLVLFNHEGLTDIFVWSTGSLVQSDWWAAYQFVLRLLPAWLLLALLARHLTLLSLGDDMARGLGLSPAKTRLAALFIAVALSASVVSCVGVVGFIGFAAPLIARAVGARTFMARIWAAPFVGAILLYFADRFVLLAQLWIGTIPTGALTALLAAPFMMFLLPRLRATDPAVEQMPVSRARSNQTIVFVCGSLLLTAAVIVALSLGRLPVGWYWASGAAFELLLDWRGPRVLAALASGALLAMAGTVVQRLSGNGMASPESLGISSGAAFGTIVLLLAYPGFDRWSQLIASFIGALTAIVGMLGVSRRCGFSPERTILAGVMLSTLFGALASVLVASGDPRLPGLLSWMAGSTYRVTMDEALVACGAMVILMAAIPAMSRWLTILPLGEAAARELGMAISAARMVVLAFAAVATGAATLVVGPLSFVGLMAPHMARLAGLRSAVSQTIGAALFGALLMVVADWLGRNLLFPRQVPAGLLASMLGSPYLIWLLWRGNKMKGI
ncbi:Fe(3+)-hydroxamate ABC transporter permease FhuB [Sinorhizobium sp. CB7]